ncbi:MAG: DUF6177 family protein [Micrococcales bacterium]|nr:DUF6177 family protein [Micrococcales bacterium]MCL2668966.1 DUF6177 family protein [Micrococcales bacterium]
MSAPTSAELCGAAPVGDVPPVGWHPAVDEFDERYVVFATPSRTVRFTEPFASFIAEAAVRRARPVLMTTPTARVSPFVSLVMRRAGGVWALQARDCTTFDALSGYQIDDLTSLWSDEGRPAGDQLPGFTDPPSAPAQVVTFDVHTHQRAERSSKVGVVAEAVATHLGTQWQCWSTREPLLDPWDVAAVTAAARGRMPESHTFRVAGTDGAFCEVQVARTRTGLLEHTVGGVRAVDGANVLETATALAETLASTHNPTVAFVSLAEYDTDEAGALVQCARARGVEAPVVALIGPRGVRDLGVDTDELAREHDVRVVGRARVPCLLVRFDGHAVQRWADLAGFAAALGEENINRAVAGAS